MSDNKFKVGDMVRRTAPSVGFVRKGYLYKVESTDVGWVTVWNDNGGKQGVLKRHFELIATDNNSNSNKDTTAMTTSRFTETVTTTKTAIKEAIDGKTSGYADISIEPIGLTTIELVVGARYCHRNAAAFGKVDLQELINELQAVHDVMVKP